MKIYNNLSVEKDYTCQSFKNEVALSEYCSAEECIVEYNILILQEHQNMF